MARRIDYKVQLRRIKSSIEREGLLLEELQTKAEELNEQDLEKVKDLTTSIDDYSRYLAILIGGYMEVCIKEITEDYFYDHASAASNYIVKTWPKSRNMWFDNMVKVLSDIDENKGQKFKRLNISELKEPLDALMQARNKIAHGASLTVVPRDVLSWLEKAEKAIDEYDIHLNT